MATNANDPSGIATTKKPDNYTREKEKIREFLSTFYLDELEGTQNITANDPAGDSDERKTFPYTDQLKRIAEREQVSFHFDFTFIE